MIPVNLSGTFTEKEQPHNGLTAIAKELLDRDRRMSRYLIVGYIRPHAGKWKAMDNADVAVAKLDQVEVILDAADADLVREIMSRAHMARTGSGLSDPLPLDELEEGEGGDTEEQPKPRRRRRE